MNIISYTNFSNLKPLQQYKYRICIKPMHKIIILTTSHRFRFKAINKNVNKLEFSLPDDNHNQNEILLWYAELLLNLPYIWRDLWIICAANFRCRNW